MNPKTQKLATLTVIYSCVIQLLYQLPCSPPTFANVKELLRSKRLLIEPIPEKVIRVQTARVLLADYELIRKDFPFLDGKSNEQIDLWILDSTGYVAAPHFVRKKVNTPIIPSRLANGRRVTREALRPQAYNRALVFQVGDGTYFIDMKGSGTLEPSPNSHHNGLASLGEMIREFIFQKMIQRIFDHSGSGRQTVANYAVVDWGFSIKKADGSTVRAGAVLRQGHQRYDAARNGRGNTFLGREESIEVEKILRTYGVTSSGERFLADQGDVINIQGTPKGEIVDFGSDLIRPHFDKPAYTYMDALKLRGGTVVPSVEPALKPGTQSWVEPDPELALPNDSWGYSVTGVADPKYDNVWVWSHELAENIAAGKAQRSDAERHVRNMLDSKVFPQSKSGMFKNIHKAYEGRVNCLKSELNMQD